MTDTQNQTSAPRRIQRKRAKGWRMPNSAVCVDRSTGFGNPFPVIKGTSTSMGVTRASWCVGTWNGPGMWFKDTKEEAVALAVEAYRVWIMQPQQETLRRKAKLALRGHDLACWCSENCPCHADILLEIANG